MFRPCRAADHARGLVKDVVSGGVGIERSRLPSADPCARLTVLTAVESAAAATDVVGITDTTIATSAAGGLDRWLAGRGTASMAFLTPETGSGGEGLTGPSVGRFPLSRPLSTTPTNVRAAVVGEVAR